MSHSELSKHDRIRQSLTQDIATGRYAPGQRLPSESALVKAFGASRPTVNRALRELQLSGVIERRAGSGSYVRKDPSGRGHVFGLLIPELGRTEIFEPICRGMADARHGEQHALLWGSSLADAANIEEQASEACAQLVEKKVAGVFFAPLELTGEKDAINRRIAGVFDRARIPLVLLDRDLVSVSGPQPVRPGRHRQPPGWLRHHRAPPEGRLPSHRLHRTAAIGADGGCPYQRLP